MAGDTQLGRAVVPIRATLDELDGDLRAAQSKIGGALSAVQGVGAVALGGVGVAAAAVGGLGVALGTLAVDAAPLEGIQASFAGITGDAEGMLKALREGSLEMASDADLMTTYNQAAQLVGKTFADQLPDAMGYLAKVSAATGKDMGFMLNSLVTGVGRVSQPILDNLDIQVSLTEATALWAKESGLAATSTIDNADAMRDMGLQIQKTEAQLLKATEKQAGFTDETSEATKAMNAVKLEELTGKLADYEAELGGLSDAHGTTFEDFDALAESMTKAQQQEAMMMLTMQKLAENTADMPAITENASTKLAQMEATVANVKDEIGLSFLPILTNVMGTISEMASGAIPILTDALQGIADVMLPVVDAIGGFVTDLLEGQDPLTAFRDLLSGLLPPETVEGIMNFVAGVQELIATVAPYVEQAAEWIAENIALQDVLIALGIAIMTVLVPAVWALISPILPVIAAFVAIVAVVALLRTVWERDLGGIRTFLENAWARMQPVLQTIGEWLSTKIPEAIGVLADWWETKLMPVLRTVWDFLSEYVLPIFAALGDLISTVIIVYFRALVGVWQNVFIPIIKKVWDWIQKVWAIIDEKLKPVLEWLGDYLREKVQPAWEGLLNVMTLIVDEIKKAVKKIKDLGESLPDWMTPGSPTPLELGLRGIAKELAHVDRLMGSLNTSMTMEAVPAAAGPARYWSGNIVIHGARDPEEITARVLRQLQDRGLVSITALR